MTLFMLSVTVVDGCDETMPGIVDVDGDGVCGVVDGVRVATNAVMHSGELCCTKKIQPFYILVQCPGRHLVAVAQS